MDYLVYLLFRAFIALFRLMPFPVAYLFSDLTYFVIYPITGYRKKVVFTNLRNSLPKNQKKNTGKLPGLFIIIYAICLSKA